MKTTSLGVTTMKSGGPGKTVLITGASKVLGRALAVEQAMCGHSVLGCSRSQDGLDALLQGDVCRGAELARVVMEKKHVPDIIVNNAGSINPNIKIWKLPVEEFDMVMDTNVKGTANMLHHFLPRMVERTQGIIVNMSSGWGRSCAALVLADRLAKKYQKEWR